MKKIIVILGLITLSQALQASTYSCKMNEKFPRKLPKNIVLEINKHKASIQSAELGKCQSVGELRGIGDSRYFAKLGRVQCANIKTSAGYAVTINLEFDEINLKLSGHDYYYSYSTVGEAKYLCTKTK